MIKRITIVNRQLLGDGLFVTPTIRALRKKYKDAQIIHIVGPEDYTDIFLDSPYCATIRATDEQIHALEKKYARFKGVMKNASDTELACIVDISRAFTWCNNQLTTEHFNINGKLLYGYKPKHFCYGIARQFDVDIDSTHLDVFLSPQEYQEGKDYLYSKYGENVILCAGFSASCSSHDKNPLIAINGPNKCLSIEQWQPVIDTYKDKYKFVFLGAGSDKKMDLKNVDWELGLPIRKVASMLKYAKLLISIDTGTGHLGAAVDANILSVCGAVPRSLTSVESTRGYYCCVDYTQQNPLAECLKGRQRIQSVKASDIINGIKAYESIEPGTSFETRLVGVLPPDSSEVVKI